MTQKNNNSAMLQNFKSSANPLYHTRFGLSLNNVDYWEKYPDMQYILVYSGGSRILFYGEEAKTVLYNLGDRDSLRFNAITDAQRTNLARHLNGETHITLDYVEPTPVEVSTPVIEAEQVQ